MAIRTIKVDITGLKEIEKAQKAVSTLRDSVLDFEKRLKKMGGKNTSTLSFNVNLKLNTDKALSDYLALKRQIENIPIKVGTKKGSNSDSNVPTVDKAKVTRPTGKSTDYVKVRDQDYQSWRNLHRAVQDVSNATFSLTSRMVSLGAVNPAKGLLATFTKVNSTVLGIQNNLLGFVGNKLSGAISNAIQGTLGAVKSGVSQLKDEANNLGDAMQIYRINMHALGFDEKETNKSIKRLGDYGKASVFDATDLLEQASTYTAYNRRDSEEIVKAYAGLLAQTKNPVQGLKTVGIQTSQMLASGYLNQQDFRFIRERFSALGASAINNALTELAKSKGYKNIIDATRHKAITADEFLDLVKQVGSQEDFQKLVTSIVTPRQALANFKETLSNLLVFDEIDDEGNAKPGALNQVYVATRDFIKGITEIVGTNKFKEYVTKLGNAIGETIKQVNQFGASWKLAFGKQSLEAIDEFSKEFMKGVKGLDVAPLFFNISKEMLKTVKSSGKSFGDFAKDLVTSISSITVSLVNLSTQFVQGGGLSVFSNYLDVFDSLGKLAVKSGSVKDFIDIYKELSSTLNQIVLSIKPTDVKSVTDSIRSLVVQVLGFIENITGKTTLISDASAIFTSIINTLSNIVNKLSKFNPQSVNKVLGYLKNTINGILKHIEPIIVELGQGAITALSSSSGENFFRALGNFIKSVTSAIKAFLTSIGGSVEGGFKKILDFLSTLVNFASKIADVLGVAGKYVVMGFIGTKFASWATNIISSLLTVATAMSSVTNGKINPLGLATNFGSGALIGQGSSAMLANNGTKVGFVQSVKNFKGSISSAYLRGKEKGTLPSAINLYGRDLGMTTFLSKGNRGRTLNPKAVGNWLPEYQNEVLNSVDPLYKAKAKLKPVASGMKEVSKELTSMSKKAPTWAKGAGMIGAQIGVDIGNSVLQNSGASQGWKDVGNVVASTASWASTGAFIGSVVPGIGTGIGAGIGALVGLGSSLYGIFDRENENKKLEEEAKKEAEKQSKEEWLQQQAHLKEISEQNNQIRDTYFKSITKDTSLVDSVVGANSTIEAIKNNSNTTVEGALSQLGIEVAKVPQNVDSLFVKIGDQVKSWKDLKDATGYTDEQLLQALQLAKSAVGEKVVEFVNETGQEVVASIQTLTDGEQHRQSSNVDTFTGKLGELGLKLQEGKEFIFKDISSTVEQLEAVKKNSSLTGDAKSKALDEVLTKLGFDTTEFVGKTIAEKMEIVNQIIKDGGTLGGTSDHQFSEIKDQITAKIAGYKDSLEGVVERIGNTELDGFLAILNDAEKLNSEGGDKANAGKIIEFQNKVLDYLNKGYLKVDEASKLFEKAGISDVSIKDLGNGKYEFEKTVTEFVAKGTKYINDGSTGLKEVTYTEEEKHNLFKSANALSYMVNQFLRNAVDVLEGAKAELRKANNFEELSEVTHEQNLMEEKINRSIGRAVGGIIPEYHYNGLPVGINWRRRGTDTVPAMLTPGEYVLRKKAVDSLGTNLLNNLNKYGVGALQNVAKSTIINNVYNTNNAQINQNIDNKSQYLNGMFGVDKLMRYV